MESIERLDEMAPGDWARFVLANQEKFLILDSETTGLDDDDVIIEFGLLDLRGNELLSTFIRPAGNVEISSGARSVHHISDEVLLGKPEFHEIYDKFISIIQGRTVLIYNAEFDQRLIEQTCRKSGIQMSTYEVQCVMRKYSEFVGEWSDKHGWYKFQRLTGGDHTAIGDCKATLKLIKKMAKPVIKRDLESQFSVGKIVARDLSSSLMEAFDKEAKRMRAKEIGKESGVKWWEFWK